MNMMNVFCSVLGFWILENVVEVKKILNLFVGLNCIETLKV